VSQIGLLLDRLDGRRTTVGVILRSSAVDVHVVGSVHRNVNHGAALGSALGRLATADRLAIQKHHTLHLDAGAILETTTLGGSFHDRLCGGSGIGGGDRLIRNNISLGGGGVIGHEFNEHILVVFFFVVVV